jgi:carboxymethylenebutenolidase
LPWLLRKRIFQFEFPTLETALMRSVQFLALASLAAVSACARQAVVDEHAGHDMSAMGGSSTMMTAGLPPSANGTAARLASSPRKSEWVKVAWEPGSPDTVGAFVVYPAKTSAKTPVVIVVHENQCLINWNRAVADQVAADGFIAIAPDLCSKARGGPVNAEVPQDQRGAILRMVTPEHRNAQISAVAKWGMSLPDASPRYGVIGYCWGGGTVFMHAIHGGIAGYSGGVAYYGTAYNNAADSLLKITKPLLLLNGAQDARIGAAMPMIDSIMKANKKDYAGVNYPDAIHGFLRAQGDSAFVRDSTAPDGRRLNTVAMKGNTAATADAWPRTIAFLRKNLGVK